MGWDIDLAKEVCAVLGVTCTINNVTFADIIPARSRSPSKYQMSFSSFTPTSAREANGIDFVTYYQAGEAWLVKVGGPTISTAADMCGHTVAVEAGTTEESDAWGYMGMKPGAPRSPAIPTTAAPRGSRTSRCSSFSTQTQANAALLSGPRRLWLGGPAGRRLPGQAGEQASSRSAAPRAASRPYGVAMVKSTGLEQAVQDAIKYLIDNDYYAHSSQMGRAGRRDHQLSRSV